MTRIERLIGIVLHTGVRASSLCLATGLVLWLEGGAARLAGVLLQIGIGILLATPVARVVVSMIEYVIERDWVFAALTFTVLVELMASAMAALLFNRGI